MGKAFQAEGLLKGYCFCAFFQDVVSRVSFLPRRFAKVCCKLPVKQLPIESCLTFGYAGHNSRINCGKIESSDELISDLEFGLLDPFVLSCQRSLPKI